MSNPELDRLKERLIADSDNGTVCIAYSGGLDSRFLAFAANYFGFKVKLCHIRGNHLGVNETRQAEKWARDHGFDLEILPVNALSIPEVKNNRKDRCYHCKKALFTQILNKYPKGLCDGTNHSDLGVYRPGIRALRELGVHSPLAEADIGKPEIRRLGQLIGMDHTDQVSKPCMLTRFPYNTEILEKRLQTFAAVEESIEQVIAEAGLDHINFRLRQTAHGHSELHLLAADREKLTDDIIVKILKVTADHREQLGEFEIVPVSSLSGYFDRIANNRCNA